LKRKKGTDYSSNTHGF
jgi:hypothetical protein